jgi:hypothetical protein
MKEQMPKPPKPEKTLPERLKEVVEILKALQQAGVSKEDPGYKELKGICDKYVHQGENFIGRVEFPRYGRYAEVRLTNWLGRKNNVVLRATEELKEFMKNRESDNN